MEAFAFLQQLEFIGVPTVSIAMLIFIMVIIKKGGLNSLLEKLKNNVAKFWIMTLISLGISFGTALLQSFPDFTWYVYLQKVFFTWIIGGFIYQKYKDTIEKLSKDSIEN